MTSRRHAFTLIELLVVIAIISVLIAVRNLAAPPVHRSGGELASLQRRSTSWPKWFFRSQPGGENS